MDPTLWSALGTVMVTFLGQIFFTKLGSGRDLPPCGAPNPVTLFLCRNARPSILRVSVGFSVERCCLRCPYQLRLTLTLPGLKSAVICDLYLSCVMILEMRCPLQQNWWHLTQLGSVNSGEHGNDNHSPGSLTCTTNQIRHWNDVECMGFISVSIQNSPSLFSLVNYLPSVHPTVAGWGPAPANSLGPAPRSAR